MIRLPLTSVIALIGLVIALAPDLRAQAPIDANDKEYISQSIIATRDLTKDKYYLGGDNCIDCHNIGNHPRIWRTEAQYWNQDHHKDAFDSLTKSERGLQIGALLKVDVTKPEAGCVQCHSVPITDQNSVTTWSQRGVYCEACHGPSSKWQIKHNVFDDWTKPLQDPVLDRQRKERKTSLGWIDIHSPVTRAELCISCHVGSKQHGRVITHAMYAAGHPPLTGYELETSADKMPRHWRYTTEKSNNVAPSYERTRNILVAAVVSMRMSVELAVADAQTKRWPELARLDCFACHHELQAPGIRPVQPGAPGRPPIIVGCVPLIHVAELVANMSSANTLVRQVNDLKEPFKNSPFGDPGEIVPRGNAIVARCRQVEDRLASMNLTSKQARVVLRELASTAADENRDYDMARQIMDAWMVCYWELVADNKSGLPDKRPIENSFAAINSRWPHFVEPVGLILKPVPPPKRDYKETLADQFKNRIDFDPPKFRNFMAKLSKQIPD